MEYFETLPDSLQQMAWRQLAEELLDAYSQAVDSHELEDRLIDALDEVIKEKPQTFVSKMEEYYE